MSDDRAVLRKVQNAYTLFMKHVYDKTNDVEEMKAHETIKDLLSDVASGSQFPGITPEMAVKISADNSRVLVEHPSFSCLCEDLEVVLIPGHAGAFIVAHQAHYPLPPAAHRYFYLGNEPLTEDAVAFVASRVK